MKKPLLSAIALFLCCCLSACSLLQVETGESSSGEEERTGTITAGISDTIRGENLMFASKNAGDGLIRQLIHGCSTVSVNEKGVYSYNKEVLESMSWIEESDGSRTYIFKIKQGLCFSDGKPITARDYVFGILLQCSPYYANLGGDTSGYSFVEGHDDYAKGASDVFSGVTLNSEYSFSLTVPSEKLPYFGEYYELAAVPYPMHIIAAEAFVEVSSRGACIGNFSQSAFNKAMTGADGYLRSPSVSSGPFSFVSYIGENDTVVLSANEYYNLSGKASVKILMVKGDVSDMAKALSDGVIDVAYSLTDKDALDGCMRLMDAGELSFYSALSNQYYYLSFDCSSGITADKRVRQAVAYALDTVSLCSLFTGSGEGALHGFGKPGGYLYENNKTELYQYFPYRYDPQKVSSLLESYSGPRIFLEYAEEDAPLAQRLKAALKEAGFTVLSEYPAEENSSCGKVSLKKGDLSLVTVTEEGSKVLPSEDYSKLMKRLTQNASTQLEKYEAQWLAYQELLGRELPAYPLFCLTEYTFYTEKAGFTAPSYGGKEGFYGLLSVYAK